MGWAYCGINSDTGEEMGYSVSGVCHYSECSKEIDHGLAYVCGGMHQNGETCGYYFCYKHLVWGTLPSGDAVMMCEECYELYKEYDEIDLKKGIKMKDNDMLIKSRWDDFRETGLLWWINRTLHIFGWSIVVVIDKIGDKEYIIDVFPARTKFRGFSSDVEKEGFKKLSRYINEVGKDLVEDSNIEDYMEEKIDSNDDSTNS